MIELTLDYEKVIRHYFPSGNDVFICLFPFYHQVFAEHYNWEGTLKKSYPLLSPISWNTIAKDIGFNSLSRIAKGILELEEPFKTELKEYCSSNKINPPDYASDRIPEVFLVELLRFLKHIGSSSIETKSVERFPNSETWRVRLDRGDEFETYSEICDAKYLITQVGIEILLPDYDCPYAIISGRETGCRELMNSCKMEYFETDANTRFDWWNH